MSENTDKKVEDTQEQEEWHGCEESFDKIEFATPSLIFGKYENGLQILKKMHLIMSEISTVQKDKKHDMGFIYLSEAMVKQTVQPLLKKHGVLFTANPIETETVEGRKITSKGTSTIITVETWMEYRFIDIASGEYLLGRFKGEGDNVTGKGLYASITGAIKYILTTHFLIPTGDDPESVKSANLQAEKKAKSIYDILLDAVAKVKPNEVEYLSDKIKEAYVTKRVVEAEYNDLCDALIKKSAIKQQPHVAEVKQQAQPVVEEVVAEDKPMSLADARKE